MLTLQQQIHWDTVYKMPTAEGLHSEQNFAARWVSESSRAGVLLDPGFTGLKINEEESLSRPENVTAFPGEAMHPSDSCSVSDDSLAGESGIPCRLQPPSPETSFPAAGDAEASRTDFVHAEGDGRNKSDLSDPLLQKLEQVRVLELLDVHLLRFILWLCVVWLTGK